eukprot:Gb_17053 [translate_table: standard]
MPELSFFFGRVISNHCRFISMPVVHCELTHNSFRSPQWVLLPFGKRLNCRTQNRLASSNANSERSPLRRIDSWLFGRLRTILNPIAIDSALQRVARQVQRDMANFGPKSLISKIKS